MMWYLDTPVMLMKRNPPIIVFCDHPHVLWLYISGKQKIQLSVAGILKCQTNLVAELTQKMPLFFRTFQKCLKFSGCL